ncbi:hypothetical protein VTH82DRAFT_3150 [Thermothelomyces myriococcoides]
MKPLPTVKNVSSLFYSIIHNLELLQLPRNFGNELKVHRLRLELLRLRLSRWGQATGVCSVEPEGSDEDNGESAVFREKAEVIEDLLDTIKNLLEKATEESQKLAPKDINGVTDQYIDTENEFGPPRFKRLQFRIHDLVKKRLIRAGNHVKGAKWVLYKKEHCEALARQMTDLLGQLEKLTVPEEKLQELAKKECDEMGDSLKTLLEVTDTVDPLLQTTAAQKLEADTLSRSVSVSAGVNYGLQIGVNYGSLQGVIIGANGTVNNNWK